MDSASAGGELRIGPGPSLFSRLLQAQRTFHPLAEDAARTSVRMHDEEAEESARVPVRAEKGQTEKPLGLA